MYITGRQTVLARGPDVVRYVCALVRPAGQSLMDIMDTIRYFWRYYNVPCLLICQYYLIGNKCNCFIAVIFLSYVVFLISELPDSFNSSKFNSIFNLIFNSFDFE